MGEKKKQKSHLPLRLNVLFFAIFILFSLLILQLGVVQILHGEDAQAEIDRTENVTSKTPVPRAKMYDRNGNLIVDNDLKYAITYTPPRNVQPEDNLETAEKLVNYMNMEDTDSVTERDMKDYWILKNREKAFSRLSSEELTLSDSEQYQIVLDRMTQEDLNSITDEEMEVIAIKRELDQATQLTPHVIKNEGISKEEYAIIAEHAHELPGISVSTDWERVKVNHPTLSNLIGNITNRNEGLPRQDINHYLSRNYSLNDRVGESGLEEEYEPYLQGQKEVRQHITNSSGEVIKSELVREGERGKDLMLSVDMELQKEIDKILQEELQAAITKHPYENRYVDRAMAVMMDPDTGEVLAISGQRYDRDKKEFYDEPYRVLYDAQLPGSAVKGATVLAGLDSGVIQPGERFRDQRLQFKGSPDKGSWTSSIGSPTDIDALKKSSNVYMFRVAMRLGGHWDYVPKQPLSYNGEGYQILSNYFKQFGLGTKTGVDYPYEATGVLGSDRVSPVKGYEVLDMAIGQFEAYTTIQLGQYVSTIANGGYRIAPRLVKQLHNPSNTEELGSVYQVQKPTILNKVEMEEQYLNRVQEGFRQVFQESGGTASSYFNDAEYKPAGKTGTAQAFIEGVETNNLSLVGYAPYDNPEVAFALIVPYTGQGNEYKINNIIGRRMLDAYFELKEERELGNKKSSEDEEESEEE
ncbi:peptidoglycan D,D-transpeptidase FtsI family protein [Piscibacillus halophilus]|uniref:serine-type D-Ala-D-Ala carboxypeptidase n=1 Tax=Piscibacillus halophilus TaxID=571933 RepID=A0A1H9MC41_9BACI|nr:penicillin-binding protein 2 [Piscibacillus halophilus]SER21340.1 cell elongation-specific peptidoglycan D,D-transpeptidase [Piscibacillus halophilus]